MTAPPWLTRFSDRGFRLLFYPTKTKGPAGVDAKDWTSRDDKPEDYNGTDNIGTFTGVEIKPGRFLCDIDLDWPEGIQMAGRILPKTSFGFGRPSRTLSHIFYTTPVSHASKEYKDIDGKMFVELRGTNKDGSIGHQTMIPPSVHPSGEVLELKQNAEIGHADDLPRRVALYAIACLFHCHLGQHGFMHDDRLALAGFLLSEGLTPEEVLAVGEAIAVGTGNTVSDVRTAVESSVARAKAGERNKGRGALTKRLGENGKKIILRVKEWLGNEDFVRDGKDSIIANRLENIRSAHEKLGVDLGFDTFSQRPIIKYNGYNGVLQDREGMHVWFQIEKEFNFRPHKDFYFDCSLELCHQNEYNPVLDYLRSLSWDGTPRIDTWLIESAKAADSEYGRAVARIVLVAAVRRVLKPGCKFDEMLVLESGQQGLMKSTALRTLCPREEWFSDDLPLNVDSKQIVERTQGKWIIEASDLSGMGQRTIEHLKGMLSRQVDGPVRMAYGRLPIEQPRRFIIIGTTNSYNYLSDPTGNRRFWPIRIDRFDLDWIRENRDQLWAEAYQKEQAGESIRLPAHLYDFAGMQQERRRQEDAWESILEPHFEDHYQRIAWDELWEVLGIPIKDRNSSAVSRVNAVMQRLGFDRNKPVRDRRNKVTKGFARGERPIAGVESLFDGQQD